MSTAFLMAACCCTAPETWDAIYTTAEAGLAVSGTDAGWSEPSPSPYTPDSDDYDLAWSQLGTDPVIGGMHEGTILCGYYWPYEVPDIGLGTEENVLIVQGCQANFDTSEFAEVTAARLEVTVTPGTGHDWAGGAIGVKVYIDDNVMYGDFTNPEGTGCLGFSAHGTLLGTISVDASGNGSAVFTPDPSAISVGGLTCLGFVPDYPTTKPPFPGGDWPDWTAISLTFGLTLKLRGTFDP